MALISDSSIGGGL